MVKKLTISDDDSTDNESLTEVEIKKEEVKTIVKPKKILSDKQKEILKQGREKGRLKLIEKHEKNKLDKKIEASKFLLEQDYKDKKDKKENKTKKIEIKESESEPDEEVVIIERKKKPKKTVKKIIIQESESESESEEEIIQVPEKKMKSQRNKKTITITNNDKLLPDSKFDENSTKKINYKNYFV